MATSTCHRPELIGKAELLCHAQYAQFYLKSNDDEGAAAEFQAIVRLAQEKPSLEDDPGLAFEVNHSRDMLRRREQGRI